jgi:porin
VTTQPTSAPATQEAPGRASAEPNNPSETGPTADEGTLTGGWFGLGRKLQEQGLSAKLSLTQVYQQDVDGGLSTHKERGRYSGRYDLEGEADLEKLINLPGGRVYALARGGWSEGIDEPSVGSLLGVNNVPMGDEPIALWQLYYEHVLLDKKVTVRVGNLDLTNCLECCETKSCFDGSLFANDETSQFLNRSLVNNPTIPFPQPGLGALIHAEPVEGWYVAAAVADADAQATETGFNTAFHGAADTLSIYETGILPKLPSANGPLQGGYRVGMWYDPQAKDRLDGSGVKRDGVGFYTSCDQMLWKENGHKDDTQGLGVFGRYGIANADVSEIKSFWSIGPQYRGLIPTRDKDVMSFGVAQGRLSRQAEFTRSNETILEWFYNIELTPCLHISPDVQYIFNPGGDASVNDAVVVGVRVQVSF